MEQLASRILPVDEGTVKRPIITLVVGKRGGAVPKQEIRGELGQEVRGSGRGQLAAQPH